MSIYFANVPLIVPTPEACEWIAANISPADVYETAVRVWPGSRLTHISFQQFIPPRPIKVGSLFWPTGADRWAVAHFVVTRDELKKIRDVCFGRVGTEDVTPFQSSPHFLKMKAPPDGAPNEFIEAEMYFLAARPLAGWTPTYNLNGMYLLTLVDERYYWWFRDSGTLDVDDTTSWSDLYDHFGNQLDIVIESEIVADRYFRPDPTSWTNLRENLPTLLEAVAQNTGQRIVRELDGTVRTLNLGTSLDRFNENLARGLPYRAGGRFNLGSANV